LGEALNKLGQEGVTLFMTHLPDLVIPLHPAEDIAVGSPIANRNRSERG